MAINSFFAGGPDFGGSSVYNVMLQLYSKGGGIAGIETHMCGLGCLRQCSLTTTHARGLDR
jgi:hypothetical protein